MRTGAIFARGSCRALNWMALVGLVLALGAGQAAAQITLGDLPELTEGAPATFTVAFDTTIPADASPGRLVLTVMATGAMPLTQDVVVDHGGNRGATTAEDFETSRTFAITPDQDDNTADGEVTLRFTLVTGGLSDASANPVPLQAPADLASDTAIAVEDDDEQGYYLQRITRDGTPKKVRRPWFGSGRSMSSLLAKTQ